MDFRFEGYDQCEWLIPTGMRSKTSLTSHCGPSDSKSRQKIGKNGCFDGYLNSTETVV
jgi:hypothetical protein